MLTVYYMYPFPYSSTDIPHSTFSTPHITCTTSHTLRITSFYRTFGCPIICTDTYSRCYFGHWHLQQCLIQASSLVSQDAIFGDKASNVPLILVLLVNPYHSHLSYHLYLSDVLYLFCLVLFTLCSQVYWQLACSIHDDHTVSLLGSIYTKHQRQHCDNSVMMLAIPLSLKTMESHQIGVANPFQVTLLFSMRRESLTSSQSCGSIDADTWCKWTLKPQVWFNSWYWLLCHSCLRVSSTKIENLRWQLG